jgi:CHAT domain-containing protein/tetratricopeptide (TPR) repeat protein
VLNRSDLVGRVTSLEAVRYNTSGDPAKALALFHQAAQIYHQIGDKPKEAGELLNAATILGNKLYKLHDARSLAIQAKELAEQSDSWLQRISALRTIADFDLTLGDYPESFNLLRDALSISNKQQAQLISSYVELQMCEPLLSMGQWEDGLNAVSSALPVLKQFKDRSSEFNAYMELIYVYGARESDLQDFDRAVGYANEAKKALGPLNPSETARLSLMLYEIHFQQGHFDQAKDDARTALSTFENKKDTAAEAGALLSLAEATRSAGDLSGAKVALTRAEPLVRQVGDLYLTGRLYYGQANLYKREGQFELSINEYQKVITILEDFKARNIGPSSGFVSEAYNYIYGELIDTYYLRGRAEEPYRGQAASSAFEMAELNKAQTFTMTWGRSLIDALRQKLPANLQEDERKIVERSTELQNELNQTVDVSRRTKEQIEDELRKVSAEEESFKTLLRQSNPVYADARYPRRMTIADLPLRPGELLVEFKMFDPSLFVWIIQGSDTGPRVLSFYKVSLAKSWFGARISDIRSAMNRGELEDFDPRESEELFSALFPGDAAKLLRSAKAIIFIPDDVLCLLPMELLSPTTTKDEFLLIQKPTSYFPSAAGLRLSRSVRRPDSEWGEDFFGIADPITNTEDSRFKVASGLAAATHDVTSSSEQSIGEDIPKEQEEKDRDVRFTTRGHYFDRLPETAHEVEKIAELFPNSSSSTTVRTGLNATKRALLETDLNKYRFLHFATHGFLPVEQSAFEPALVLSLDGVKEGQMMLTVSEISKMSVHADMVVLSACNTGSGKVTRAEGVSSLGSAFLAAGASSVVVSLWKVADNSTSLLMQQFYKNLLSGMPKNQALAEARTQLAKSGKVHPFYWAPFVLSGD